MCVIIICEQMITCLSIIRMLNKEHQKGGRNMNIAKKALSVFMAVLMLMSALSVSFYGAAAEVRKAEDYRALAYSFFNYTVESSGTSSVNVITRDENGFPVRSIVGDMDH